MSPSAVRLAIGRGLATVPQLVLPIATVALIFGFALIEPRVLSVPNIMNIAIQCSYLSVFAMAQAVVILTRGFDLSLGYTVSFVSVLTAMVMVATGSVWPGILAGLSAGLLVGLANGLFVGLVGLNPLVTTMGTSYVMLALASTVSDGAPVGGMPEGFNAVFASGHLLGVPVPVVVAGTIALALVWILAATPFGRSLYLVGANPRAAIAAGLSPARSLVGAYMISGFLTACGAVLLTARTNSGEPNLGGSLTMEAIAAAVVGGVKLSGGEGGVLPALLGALFVTAMANGMNLIRIDGYIQQICLGVLIIVSLVISGGRRR